MQGSATFFVSSSGNSGHFWPDHANLKSYRPKNDARKEVKIRKHFYCNCSFIIVQVIFLQMTLGQEGVKSMQILHIFSEF